MSYEVPHYSEFYRNAWRENVYNTNDNTALLNNADDAYWVAYASALQAFEKSYALAKQGFSLQECKEIYLAFLEGKATWTDTGKTPCEIM